MIHWSIVWLSSPKCPECAVENFWNFESIFSENKELPADLYLWFYQSLCLMELIDEFCDFRLSHNNCTSLSCIYCNKLPSSFDWGNCKLFLIEMSDLRSMSVFPQVWCICDRWTFCWLCELSLSTLRSSFDHGSPRSTDSLAFPGMLTNWVWGCF